MAETRVGDWIQTFTGTKFYPLDPRPEEVDIRDVAHALGQLCRFGGHCREFYSVAQHSVLVSYACDPADALWGLLHDASEAYLCDLPRPIKRAPRMHAYQDAEIQVQHVIYLRFGLKWQTWRVEACWIPDSVHRADEVLLATEARDLMRNHCLERWSSIRDVEPLADPIVPWNPLTAEMRFRERFLHLTRGRG